MSIDRRRGTWIQHADVGEWDLPRSFSQRLFWLLTRAVTRRCPYCGASGIFASFWTLRERCPNCGVVFEREDGYFLGAYAINLIVAETAGFGGVLALLIWTDLSTLSLQIIAVAVAIGLPLFGFPFARSLWMVVDLMIHHPEDQPRG